MLGDDGYRRIEILAGTTDRHEVGIVVGHDPDLRHTPCPDRMRTWRKLWRIELGLIEDDGLRPCPSCGEQKPAKDGNSKCSNCENPTLPDNYDDLS